MTSALGRLCGQGNPEVRTYLGSMTYAEVTSGAFYNNPSLPKPGAETPFSAGMSLSLYCDPASAVVQVQSQFFIINNRYQVQVVGTANFTCGGTGQFPGCTSTFDASGKGTGLVEQTNDFGNVLLQYQVGSSPSTSTGVLESTPEHLRLTIVDQMTVPGSTFIDKFNLESVSGGAYDAALPVGKQSWAALHKLFSSRK